MKPDNAKSGSNLESCVYTTLALGRATGRSLYEPRGVARTSTRGWPDRSMLVMRFMPLTDSMEVLVAFLG